MAEKAFKIFNKKNAIYLKQSILLFLSQETHYSLKNLNKDDLNGVVQIS
jgi:hypothetical protein